MRSLPRQFALAFAFIAALPVAGFWETALAQQSAVRGGPPDILGIQIGMPPQKAYELFKAHDLQHVVALEQTTIPQLYGDKPIVYGMALGTFDSSDQMYASISLPPNPQVVWQIHRQMGPFTSSSSKVIQSLHDKYGTPWNPNPAVAPNPQDGSLTWLFDANGQAVQPATLADSLAVKNCMAQVMGYWAGAEGVPMASVASMGSNLTPGRPRTKVEDVPTFYAPGKIPRCENLTVVQVVVNSGLALGAETSFTLTFTISDFSLQHRTFFALHEALNDIVGHGIRREQIDAQKQAVPKM